MVGVYDETSERSYAVDGTLSETWFTLLVDDVHHE
jgi:hypothetical protein